MAAVRNVTTLALLALLVLPALATGATSVGSSHERVVARTLPTPTPLGPVDLLADDARWRVDVPPEAVVRVTASSNAAQNLFFLSRHRADAGPSDVGAPTSYGILLLPPGSWIVRVDPAAGVHFRATVLFEGFVVDVGGAPASFGLTDLRNDRACVLPGACLP